MQIVEYDSVSDELEIKRSHDTDIVHPVKERVIGYSRWAAEARQAITSHAAHDNPLLIEGEPGTGKEFLARLVHESSARRHGPFVAVACHTISDETLEAMLFGWIRQLSSGRNRVQRGLVESAHGGTLYVGGAATLSPVVKMKIARLIEYGEFRRPDEHITETADVRVMLGLKSGTAIPEEFSLFVHNRLSALPLRQRAVDIEPLSLHFVETYCREAGKERRELCSDTIGVLRRYTWPGNISELKRVIQEMIERSKPACLDPSLLASHVASKPDTASQNFPTAGVELNEKVKEYESALICEALRQSHGSQTKAARLLGLKLTTLCAKIARYEIDVEAFQ